MKPRGDATQASAVAEDYTKVIYALTRTEGTTAATSDLARRLGTTAGTVSATLRRLATAGLVHHVPYAGARLTDDGERLALQVIRRHRLLEQFLHQSLGLGWDEVHAEAELLEHAVSPKLEQAIAFTLGNPTHDPHGDPIPAPDGTMPEMPTKNLAALNPGAVGTLAHVSDADPEVLRYLTDCGIGLGDRVEVLDKAPFGGPLTVRFGDQERPVGDHLAAALDILLPAQASD